MPLAVYDLLALEAHKHNRSISQFVLELVRDSLTRHYGFKCDHDPKFRKHSVKAKIWYCASCGSFYERTFNMESKDFEFTIVPSSWEMDAIMKLPMGPLAKDLR